MNPPPETETMKTRTLLPLLAALLLWPALAHAQRGTPAADTLPTFGSRRELTEWLSAHDRERQRHRAKMAAAAAQPAPPPACPATTAPPSPDSAKGPAVVRGRVTSATGAPLESAAVRACVPGSTVGAVTAADGSYALVIPGGRMPARR
jgi:hypothetical protein